ncbi:mitogen-activated protein kinase kinase kinase 20-like [Apium graveolens]|uniref:mitogen-activated protein kinase kinase kinase 20-like n=1 Tax=Apium graveolens TaxID=4045 RepID=UPI003D7A43E0
MGEFKGCDDYKYGNGVAWIRGQMIGKGSFGCVFLANLKRPRSRFRCFPCVMAVKSAEVSISGSIQKEKEVLSNVGRCDYVIRCFGEEISVGENGEMVYNLLLEYGCGGSLGDLIKKSRLGELDVRRYARGMLRGVYDIHESGYVHCDLKPDNVLLVRNGKGEFRVKIGDLGLAKRDKVSKKRKLSPYWRGTPMYLAPEAVTDCVQGFASDIWGVGCIVLEMLTGKHPWGMEDCSADELLAKIGDRHELPKIPEDVSVEARSFLKGCFVRNPMYRLTAEMLLNHPFLEGLVEDDQDEESEEVSDVNTGSSLLLLSDVDDELDYSSLSDDCSFVSEDEDGSYWSEEEVDGEMVAEEETLEVKLSRDNTSSSISSEFSNVINTSIQGPSNARQQHTVTFTIPAGV